MGDCQNYGPFLGPYYNTGPNTGPKLGDPKRDHNFDNPPYVRVQGLGCPDIRSLMQDVSHYGWEVQATTILWWLQWFKVWGLGFRV